MFSFQIINILVFVLINTGVQCGDIVRPARVKVEDIYSKILHHHNHVMPPSQNISIGVGFDVHKITDMDSKHEVISVRGTLHLYWNDLSLSWNKKQYPEMKNVVQVPSARIWTPQIKLVNSVANNFDANSAGPLLSISPNGEVHWKIIDTFMIFFSMDATWYPFDQQAAFFKFESFDEVVHLGLQDEVNSANLDHTYPSGIWDIIETPIYENKFPILNSNRVETDVTIFLVIRRRTYWVTQVYPFLAFGFLTLLPCVVARVNNKIIIQLICLAGLFLFCMETTDVLPQNSYTIPHIFVSLCPIIIINLVHLALTCIISNCGKNGCCDSKRRITKGMVRKISKFLCLANKQNMNLNVNMKEIGDKDSEIKKIDGAQFFGRISAFFHFLVFISVLAGVVISTVYFLLAHPHRD